jgi:hypothetical protein
MPLLSASETYIKEMSKLKMGYPLYDPEDDMSPGDVGFIQSENGKFRRLFNIFLPADHHTHTRFGVPNGFEPLRLEDLVLDINDFSFPPQAITSRSVQTIEVNTQVST